ncbi:MAG: molybdate ABC transporter substrate-binding protein [Propionicimonas sp.]
MSTSKRLVAGLAASVLLTACAPNPGRPATELVVLAAASLSGTFPELGREFVAGHPGVKVTFSFDGSAALLDQLTAGAPADVFAAADRASMDKADAAGLIAADPVVFAGNLLTLVVPKGNPAGITGLDATLAGRKLVICADGVPCGSATRKLAAALGVPLHPVSEETKVTDVRTKVESGQADVGIVYVTDAQASADLLDAIPISGAETVRNEYLIGVVAESPRASLATEFIELVDSDRGRQVLRAAGFGP